VRAGGRRRKDGLDVDAAQVPRESQQVIGGQVGEGGHPGARIATLQIAVQLLDRLYRDPRIHHESRPLAVPRASSP
jgi:hypothetical protein